MKIAKWLDDLFKRDFDYCVQKMNQEAAKKIAANRDPTEFDCDFPVECEWTNHSTCKTFVNKCRWEEKDA